ncbi:MAG TPA: hypothetical protein VF657_20660, partial [Actinoplanes sp.]
DRAAASGRAAPGHRKQGGEQRQTCSLHDVPSPRRQLWLSPVSALGSGAALLREHISLTTPVGLLAIVAGFVLAAQRAEPTSP